MKFEFIKDKNNWKKGDVIDLDVSSVDYFFLKRKCCIVPVKEKKKEKKKNESILEND